MVDKKLSIIVPVYNTAPYLDECLNSIIDQTYQNLEIIIVDDCSTDESSKIIEQYEQKDNRIKTYYHTLNKGLGVTRNLGLTIASGDYILFIDSDDYISRELVEKLITTLIMDGIDILIFNGVSFNHEKGNVVKDKYYMLEEEYFTSEKSYINNIMRIIDTHSACLKMYDLNFLRMHKITFPEGILGEDVEFWFRCLMATTRIRYLDYRGYMRRLRKGSIMLSGNEKNITDRLDNLPALLEISEENEHLFNYLLHAYIPCLAKRVYDSGNERVINYFHDKINSFCEDD